MKAFYATRRFSCLSPGTNILPSSKRIFSLILNIIGLANTKELFLGGEYVDAARAREMGLVRPWGRAGYRGP